MYYGTNNFRTDLRLWQINSKFLYENCWSQCPRINAYLINQINKLLVFTWSGCFIINPIVVHCMLSDIKMTRLLWDCTMWVFIYRSFLSSHSKYLFIQTILYASEYSYNFFYLKINQKICKIYIKLRIKIIPTNNGNNIMIYVS